jgi:DNA repair protein RecN (Recombination protein N)
VDQAKKVMKSLEALGGLGADLGDAPELLGQALVNLEEVAGRLENFFDGVDLDPERLDETLGRMDLLARLKKKYGPSLEEVVATRQRVEAELDRLENLEGKSQDIAGRLAAAEKSLAKASEALSAGRQAAAKKLTAAVAKELKEVGLPHAEFEVSAAGEGSGAPVFTAAGADQVQFLFAPNPGEGKKPLAAVASGGELSRVMLALKSVLSKTDAVPVLVFDEIDAGVGGVLGGTLGRKLAKLGKSHQVLCITHLATIAACADVHFRVEKDVRQGRTRTLIENLEEEARVVEIARLFGSASSDPGAIGLRHARELLAESRA